MYRYKEAQKISRLEPLLIHRCCRVGKEQDFGEERY